MSFVTWLESRVEYKYLTLICDSSKGKFPSDHINHAAMFRYPANMRWPSVRKAIYQAVKQFGFDREHVSSVEQIEEDNWNRGKKWAQFDYQNGFVLVNAPQKKKKVAPAPNIDVDGMLRDRLRQHMDFLKSAYTRAGWTVSDEQVEAQARKQLKTPEWIKL